MLLITTMVMKFQLSVKDTFFDLIVQEKPKKKFPPLKLSALRWNVLLILFPGAWSWSFTSEIGDKI